MGDASAPNTLLALISPADTLTFFWLEMPGAETDDKTSGGAKTEVPAKADARSSPSMRGGGGRWKVAGSRRRPPVAESVNGPDDKDDTADDDNEDEPDPPASIVVQSKWPTETARVHGMLAESKGCGLWSGRRIQSTGRSRRSGDGSECR
jgi:hypothetical protein